jgi:hypothetical protein
MRLLGSRSAREGTQKMRYSERVFTADIDSSRYSEGSSCASQMRDEKLLVGLTGCVFYL